MAELTRLRRSAFAVVLIAGSLMLGLAGLEALVRSWRGAGLSPPASAAVALELHASPFPVAHDAGLGHVPRAGAVVPADRRGGRVTIRMDGLRSNGRPGSPAGLSVLAVGDSYTFGDEVADAETWPAQLEARLGRPVRNGGVFGYGFDQTVLRAERLLERHGDVDLLLVGVIPDDVLRCEFAYRYAWKPYFALEPAGLALRGVPVPRPEDAPPPQSLLRGLARYSHVADLLYLRLDPTAWVSKGVLRVHRDGPEVAVRLVERLAKLAESHDVGLLLVVQWHPESVATPLGPALARAHALRLDVLELEPLLRADLGNDPAELPRFFLPASGRAERFVAGHMSADGNGRVAFWIAEHLRGAQPNAEPPPDRS